MSGLTCGDFFLQPEKQTVDFLDTEEANGITRRPWIYRRLSGLNYQVSLLEDELYLIGGGWNWVCKLTANPHMRRWSAD
jgi:hypothetical protein